MCVSKPVCSCKLSQFVDDGMSSQMWALHEGFRKGNGFGDDVIAHQPSLTHAWWCTTLCAMSNHVSFILLNGEWNSVA